ncbi:hypothetical protein BT96DRAFT_1020555 [Gymnopus androsaceus JB14]|uniref:Uncharacterized protein n=1 Tax=Gymnopus androsaceus JB14 TaxID=1447944 RepID=A0A6A4HIF7_9AGAR|nr:hypothetical protein BT96DRAFT_1020555 [Gymnopus androsaceus JB14]
MVLQDSPFANGLNTSKFSINLYFATGNPNVKTGASGLGTLTEGNGTRIVQLSELTSNASAYMPVEDPSVVTVSPLTTYTIDMTYYVFRCQNCSLMEGHDKNNKNRKMVDIDLMFSMDQPEFINPETSYSTMFPVTSSLNIGKVRKNLDDLVVKDYDELLRDASL